MSTSIPKSVTIRVTHEHGDRLAFLCPACMGVHEVKITGSPRWDWNGSRERPTFRPSIRVTSYTGSESARVCHSFVTDGVIDYCGDSTHDLCAQKRVLQPFPDPYRRDG